MDAKVEIPQSALNQAIQESLFKGELGQQVAEKLAALYAEITLYNRTDAAKLLNIGRNTLYDYEKAGLVKFNSNRISAAALAEFARFLTSEKEDEEPGVLRKEKQEKRRRLK